MGLFFGIVLVLVVLTSIKKDFWIHSLLVLQSYTHLLEQLSSHPVGVRLIDHGLKTFVTGLPIRGVKLIQHYLDSRAIDIASCKADGFIQCFCFALKKNIQQVICNTFSLTFLH